MTFSIELLPAPLGPMMARISRRRTSKDTPWSALTPPKAREMASTLRMGSAATLRRRGAADLRLGDAQVRRDHAGAPVLEAHLRLDEAVRPARIQRVDERGVFLGDVAPPHLARARELAVVGVELLVQDDEPPDLRVGELGIAGEVAVDALDAVAHQVVHRGLGREVDVSRVRE